MAKPKFLKKINLGKSDDGFSIDSTSIKEAPTGPESPYSDVDGSFADMRLDGKDTTDSLEFEAPSDIYSAPTGSSGLAFTEQGDKFDASSGGTDLLLVNSYSDERTNENRAPTPDMVIPSQSSSKLTVDAPMDSSEIIDNGVIWARVTPNKMFLKDWQEMSWVQYGEMTLYIFRNRQDYMDWQHFSFQGGMTSSESRDRLVKKKIDFAAELVKKNVQGYTLSQVGVKAYNQIGNGTPL